MKRRFIGAAVTTSVLLGVTTVAFAPNALAATCPSGHVCMFQNINWGGGRYVLNGYALGDFQGLKFDNGVALNDHVSSMINNTTEVVYWFKDSNFDDIRGYDATCDEKDPASQDRATLRYNDAYSSILLAGN